MSVGAHPQKDQVKARNLTRLHGEELAQGLFVGFRGGRRIRILRRNPKDIAGCHRNF